MDNFIIIHALTTYPASLLNRSDNGRPKTAVYGGTLRTRVSSQCLKFHARWNQGEHSIKTLAHHLDLEGTQRSRWTFEDQVFRPVVEELSDDVDADVARLVVSKTSELVTGKAPSQDEQDEQDEESSVKKSPATLKLDQILAMGEPEIRFLRERVRDLCLRLKTEAEVEAFFKRKNTWPKEVREHFAGLEKQVGPVAAGLDASLHGRMVTGDVLSRVDSAVKVSHALTVHPHTAEIDYFSAIDDLQHLGKRKETGHAHGGYADLTTGTFYRAVVLDVGQIRMNLGKPPQDRFREMLEAIVREYVWIVATVSPGAKTGSTAPYAWADLVAVETGRAEPRQLMGAWYNAVPQSGDVLRTTYKQLDEHLGQQAAMYGDPWRRAYAAGSDLYTTFGTRLKIPEMGAWTVKEGK